MSTASSSSSSLPANSTYAMLAAVMMKSLSKSEAQNISFKEETIDCVSPDTESESESDDDENERQEFSDILRKECLTVIAEINNKQYSFLFCRIIRRDDSAHLIVLLGLHLSEEQPDMQIEISFANEANISYPENDKCIHEMDRVIRMAIAAFA